MSIDGKAKIASRLYVNHIANYINILHTDNDPFAGSGGFYVNPARHPRGGGMPNESPMRLGRRKSPMTIAWSFSMRDGYNRALGRFIRRISPAMVIRPPSRNDLIEVLKFNLFIICASYSYQILGLL